MFKILQVARFGIVGLSALSVHWLIVAAIVPLGMPPLRANVVAFLVAFQVSYWGHRIWTFNANHRPHRATFPRFALAACAGFAVKQLLYFLLLNHTTMDYRLSLFIVLMVVAAISFVANNLWAFRSAKA